MYHFFLWDPDRERFSYDAKLSEMPNPEFHPEEEYVCSLGRGWGVDYIFYEYRKEGWTAVRRIQQWQQQVWENPDEGDVLTIQDEVDGELVTVYEDVLMKGEDYKENVSEAYSEWMDLSYTGEDKLLLSKENSNPIDAGMAELYDEFGIGTPGFNFVSWVEAEAWEKEFYHCEEVLRNAILVYYEDDWGMDEEDLEIARIRREDYLDLLDSYVDYVELWAADNVEIANMIEGTGQAAEVHMGRTEAYRTATLTMLAFYREHHGGYDYIYDYEEAREVILNAK